MKQQPIMALTSRLVVEEEHDEEASAVVPIEETETAPDLAIPRFAIQGEDGTITTLQTPHATVPTEVFNDDETLFVVFDLETTGFSKERHHIIEIACEILAGNGKRVSDAQFSALIRPPTPIPGFITELTGITNEMVATVEGIEITLRDFVSFLQQKISDVEDEETTMIRSLVLLLTMVVVLTYRFFFIN